MKITSSQFIRNIGQYQDQAQLEPVIVTKRNREHTVLLSVAEYRRLWRLARVAKRTEDMSAADIESIDRAEVPLGHDHPDDELD